ncbi:hypothetical protein [Isoptericola sp. NPDC057559]|uniref:hypothetical protein n=1 Tax=Isoptericola sp. NPDC057559 TaxID=3346168 RepID=UPI003690E703
MHSETDLAFARENLAFAQVQEREDIAGALSDSIDKNLAERSAPPPAVSQDRDVIDIRALLDEANARIAHRERRPTTRVWDNARRLARRVGSVRRHDEDARRQGWLRTEPPAGCGGSPRAM